MPFTDLGWREIHCVRDAMAMLTHRGQEPGLPTLLMALSSQLICPLPAGIKDAATFLALEKGPH